MSRSQSPTPPHKSVYPDVVGLPIAAKVMRACWGSRRFPSVKMSADCGNRFRPPRNPRRTDRVPVATFMITSSAIWRHWCGDGSVVAATPRRNAARAVVTAHRAAACALLVDPSPSATATNTQPCFSSPPSAYASSRGCPPFACCSPTWVAAYTSNDPLRPRSTVSPLTPDAVEAANSTLRAAGSGLAADSVARERRDRVDLGWRRRNASRRGQAPKEHCGRRARIRGRAIGRAPSGAAGSPAEGAAAATVASSGVNFNARGPSSRSSPSCQNVPLGTPSTDGGASIDDWQY